MSRSWEMGFPLNTLLYLFWRSIVRGKIDWVSNVARSNVRRPSVPRSNGGSQMSWTCWNDIFHRSDRMTSPTFSKHHQSTQYIWMHSLDQQWIHIRNYEHQSTRQTLTSKDIRDDGIFSGPAYTAKCLQPALARIYRGSSPCRPLTNAVAISPLRYGSSP